MNDFFQGLRLSVLLGSFGTCLGSWIKVLATGRSHFPIMFAGQTIVAISQIFILGIPAQLAATWFPSSQVSSACAIGVFGNQVKNIFTKTFRVNKVNFDSRREREKNVNIPKKALIQYLRWWPFSCVCF